MSLIVMKGVERYGVGLALHRNARRVVVPGDVQRPDVEDHHASDHERQQVVQREEAVQRRVVHREAAPQPLHDRRPDQGDRGEEVGDDRRAPERHLPPRQDVAHEGGGHHQDEDDDAEHPQDLARRLIGTVVEPARDVQVHCDEEHRRAHRMNVADQPTVVDVAHDVLDALERDLGVRGVVHGEDDAADDHRHQHEGQHRAEGPHVVEVLRRREVDRLLVGEREDRQSRVDPTDRLVLRLEGGVSVSRHGASSISRRRSSCLRWCRGECRGSRAPARVECALRCRSASRGRGRTSRRSRPADRAGCSRGGCRCRS